MACFESMSGPATQALQLPARARRRGWLALTSLLGCLIAGVALAIPQENEPAPPPPDAPGDTTASTSSDISDTDTPSVVTDDTQAAESLRMLQHKPATNRPPLLSGETGATFKVIGHYDERLKNMDVAEMASRALTNDALQGEQAISLKTDPVAVSRDLATPTNENDTSERQLHETIKAVAAESPKTSDEEMKNVRLAVTYLIMAAVIILVIFARR